MGGAAEKPWEGLWRSRWNNYRSESENKKFILLIHQFNQAVSLLHPVLESHFIPDKDSSDNSLLQKSTSFPGSFISPTQRGPRPSLTLGWGDERPWKRGCYKELSQSLLKQWRYSFFLRCAGSSEHLVNVLMPGTLTRSRHLPALYFLSTNEQQKAHFKMLKRLWTLSKWGEGWGRINILTAYFMGYRKANTGSP